MFVTDVVRLDQNTVVNGQKIFSGHVTAEDLMTTSINLQNVAGVDLPQLQKDVYRYFCYSYFLFAKVLRV